MTGQIDAEGLPRVVAVTGGWKSPSRTRALSDAVIAGLALQRSIAVTRIDLAEVGKQVAGIISRDGLPPETAALFHAVETADLIVAGSPIFKASYTGIFKHFFDLFPPTTLTGKPVLLVATGGSERHMLALEHQFRPLFSFFSARSLATTVYAVEGDFQSGEFVGPVQERIDRAVAESVRELDRLRPPAQAIPLRVVTARRHEQEPIRQVGGITQ